jgi:stage III sporulation protein SpoIIIAA
VFFAGNLSEAVVENTNANTVLIGIPCFAKTGQVLVISLSDSASAEVVQFAI